MRESGPAFFSALTLHSLAMGFVVGINFLIVLRLIGFSARLDITSLRRFYPLHWYCAALVLLSGLALLLAYPAKALTNPVFYVKLLALVLGLLIARYFQRSFASQSAKAIRSTAVRLAYLSLFLWIVVLSAGRFLAYTHSILLASRFY